MGCLNTLALCCSSIFFISTTLCSVPVGLCKTVTFLGTGHKYCPAVLSFTEVEGNCVKLKNILVAWPHAPVSATRRESHEYRKIPFYLRVIQDRKEQHWAPWHARWSKNYFPELTLTTGGEEVTLMPLLKSWLAHVKIFSLFIWPEISGNRKVSSKLMK